MPNFVVFDSSNSTLCSVRWTIALRIQATYPVLKVVYDGAFVTYSQEPFILNATSVLGPAPYNYQWIIPVFSQNASGMLSSSSVFFIVNWWTILNVYLAFFSIPTPSISAKILRDQNKSPKNPYCFIKRREWQPWKFIVMHVVVVFVWFINSYLKYLNVRFPFVQREKLAELRSSREVILFTHCSRLVSFKEFSSFLNGFWCW